MSSPAPGPVDRLLRPFSKVEPGEGPRALLMLACVFLILTAYYVMKTAREGLILAGGTFGLAGDELKLYATGAMALLLLGLVPAYSRLADRVRRIRLINISYALVMGSLVVFFALGRAGVPVGLPFFIWLGLVSVFLIAQFWSYANDVYTEEQGKRLFAIIAIGGSLGAIVGPRIAAVADTFSLMLVAAAILVASVVLFNVIERMAGARGHDRAAAGPTDGPGGFALVLRDRYLLLIAALVLVVNIVNTTGEFVLSNAVREHAIALVPDGADSGAIEAQRREIIKAFFSDFFFWVNLVGFLVQAFLVSRIIGTLGVRGALFVLPVIAFGAYAAIGIVGGLALLRVAKIAENATDYSLQNTVRQALFLPTDRAVKYKAKATIDTFVVRLGDTLSAVLVGVGLHQLGLGPRQLVFANLILVAGWLAIAVGIALHYRTLCRERSARSPLGRLSPAGGTT
jgi:ATP:ADP antiporter, AAA family